MSTQEKTHLGIVLAGAVTAGAFTAGVMSYLINTLTRWEEAYQKDPTNVPKPNVIIDVLTGASAGSIAAAVTTLGLATDSLASVQDVRSDNAKENLLYDTWVNLGMKEGQEVLDSILELNDIEKDEEDKAILRSLLNTSFIDAMMSKLIQKSDSLEKKELPSFVNPNLDILMTLSNLRGLPIDLYFSSSKESVGHTMSYHKAYALFQFGKKVYDKVNSPEKLSFDITNNKHVEFFLNCARASGAFPIGLKSIPFNHIPKEYINSNIKRLFGDDVNIVPRVEENYDFLAVDGGMTNNEPLAEAMKSLESKGDNYKMILIDPFPSDTLDDKKQYNTKKDSVFDIIPQLYKTLRNQAIFKESDIVDLFREDANKHMIWPTRYDENHKPLKNAIACGALSGFSGFLNREFRLHDFQLGQKNAQNFLRFYFHKELEESDAYSQAFIEKFSIKDEEGKIKIPVIPDYTIENREEKEGFVKFYPAIEDDMMEFPIIDFKPILDKLKPKLDTRIKAIIDISFDKITKPKEKEKKVHPLILEQDKKKFFAKLLTPIKKKVGKILMGNLGKGLLKNTLSKRIIKIMIEEMDEYKLIK